MKMSELRASYPSFEMAKLKVDLAPGTPVDRLLSKIAAENQHLNPDTRDGVKIDLAEGWVHMRKSNTEPIIRIYSEGKDEAAAQRLARLYAGQIESLVKNC